MPTLFDFLPIGAYRSTESGRMLRANAALVRFLGYGSEEDALVGLNDMDHDWYVSPGRRAEFRALLKRDGQVVNFVSEVYWERTQSRCWIRETAHQVRAADGQVVYYEGTVEDITAAHLAHQALASSETLLRQMAAQVPGMLYRTLYQGRRRAQFLFVSAGVQELFQLTPEQVMKDPTLILQRRHPQDFERVDQAVVKSVKERGPLNIEYRVVLDDGTVKWIHLASSFISEDAQGQIRNGVMLDITTRKLAELDLMESEARWKLALESTGDGVWDWYVQTGDEYFSRRCKEIYGFEEHEIPDRSDALDGRTHPDDLQQMLRDRQAHFDGQTPSYTNEHRILCKDGSWKWVLTRGMVIARDSNGQPLRMIGTHTDISARKEAEAMVWRQAHFDPLTGLPNRRTLREHLSNAIRNNQQSGEPVAVLFIDLDHFKEVNDTLGHDSGDMLLVEAARRIAQCLGPQDTVARMGGDEFTVVLGHVPQAQALDAMLQGILDRLASVFHLETEQVFVSASMGIAMYPRDATQVENLFKHADQALYVAKGAGRNRYSFFTPELQEAAQNRLRLAADLRLALAAQQFEVVYQPIVHLATGAIHKAEALLRWHHPQRGLVSPAQFIGIAESTGLIIDIGEWVLREVAAQVKIWREVHHTDFQVSVNKSPVQFQATPNAPWNTVLEQMGLPGSCIAVEITEGLLLDPTTVAMQQLQAHGDAGMQISLDDFGTGYSSLTYLQRFAIDYIKIDQSFVRNLHTGSTDLALCKAIILMAHELGMQVIAEGVETEAQRDLLVRAGCDFGQGYLFARPMSAADFEKQCFTPSA